MDLVLVFHNVIYTAAQLPFFCCLLSRVLFVGLFGFPLSFFFLSFFLPFFLYKDSSCLDGLFFLLVSVQVTQVLQQVQFC